MKPLKLLIKLDLLTHILYKRNIKLVAHQWSLHNEVISFNVFFNNSNIIPLSINRKSFLETNNTNITDHIIKVLTL